MLPVFLNEKYPCECIEEKKRATLKRKTEEHNMHAYIMGCKKLFSLLVMHIWVYREHTKYVLEANEANQCIV